MQSLPMVSKTALFRPHLVTLVASLLLFFGSNVRVLISIIVVVVVVITVNMILLLLSLILLLHLCSAVMISLRA